MNETIAPQAVGNHADASYDEFLARVNARFLVNVEGGKRPLFTTDADGLWAAYLGSFPDDQRQYHNCHCCRTFIERFGGLVTIDECGATAPAIWHEDDAPELYRPAVQALARLARRGKVTGVFLSSEKAWGQHETGPWHHLAVTPSGSMVFTRATQTAGQAMAEKREDFKTVMHALNEFTQPMIEQALTLLRTDALYRSEKVLGQAEWLYGLHVARAAAHGSARANAAWLAIGTAPAGFCHPRSSMIGTLLEDIAAGMDFGDVSRRFAAKMHPLQYQRPQAAPSAGAIAQAEKIMEQLGAAGSLARRFARLEEIEAIWRPTEKADAPNAGGVFGHLKPKGATPEPMSMRAPAITMTWEKFARTALMEAKQIDVMVPSHGQFIGIMTAANADAPPILQWDSLERRNPFSLYVYHGGSHASNWGLTPGVWEPVAAISLRPTMWHGAEFSHHAKGAHLVLERAKDSRKPSACIFPETLKSEFHGIRSVIEAFSRNAQAEGAAEASANGLDMIGAHIRVTPATGPAAEYKIDRWD